MEFFFVWWKHWSTIGTQNLFSITPPVSNIYGEWGQPVIWIYWLHKDIETQYKSKQFIFLFNSCMGVFSSDTTYWCMIKIQLTYTVMAPAQGKMTHIATSGGWRTTVWQVNICASHTFFNNFIKMMIFFTCLLVGKEFQTTGYQITGCLLYSYMRL